MPRHNLLRSRSQLNTFDGAISYNHPHPDLIKFNVADTAIVNSSLVKIKDGDSWRGSIGSLHSVSSEYTIRSSSSCSWNEETDHETTERLKHILDAVDNYLYEGKESDCLSEELVDDCRIWNKQFPHLRVKGEQLNLSVEQNSYIDEEESLIGETICVDGNIHSGTPSQGKRNSFDPNEIKEMVLDQLLSQLLSKISEWQKATAVSCRSVCGSARYSKSGGLRSQRRLRPLTADESNRPISDDQALEGILLVSSKILQDREGSSRPCSAQLNCKNIQRRIIRQLPTLSTIPNSQIISDFSKEKQFQKCLFPSMFGRNRKSSWTFRPSTGENRDDKAHHNKGILPVLSVHPSKLLSPRSSAKIMLN